MDALKQKRAAVIELYRNGQRPGNIFRQLQTSGYKRDFVYRTLRRYHETGGVSDRKHTGRPRSVRTAKLVKNVKARIRRNPRRSGRKLAGEMGTSHTTMRRVLKEDLGLMPLKMRKTQMLNQRTKRARKERCQALLQRFTPDKLDRILFSDEKLFQVEAKWNTQNNRVYGKSVKELPEGVNKMQRTQHPASVMVWAGVSAMGKASLVFVDQGVKIRKENYIADILEPHVRPLTHDLFKNGEWWFQQDSAPAHKALTTQNWCQDNLPGFISTAEWPASSPDLNPMDYYVWSKLEQMACSRNHPNVESLKRSLVKAWSDLPMEEVRAAIHSWRGRLSACVKAKGSCFEV